MGIDKVKIEKHVKGILEALGENPNREGLKETPKRVANMLEEVLEGINYTNDDIVNMFNKTFEEDLNIEHSSKDIVIMKDIEIFSYCEHHLALMYNMKVAVAYIPNKKIIGLSKIARVADMVSRRLQLQERIGTDILYIMQKIVDTDDVAIIIEGEHACMTTRGIKKPGTKTVTTVLRGKFEKDKDIFDKLMCMYKM